MLLRIFKFIAILTVLVFVGATLAAAQQTKRANKQTQVKIYLQKTEIDPSGATSLETVAVKRRVDRVDALRATFESLFAAISAAEAARGLSSSTTGTEFEGGELKKGTALVRFSEPPGDATADLGIFKHAIEQTAKQFRAVKQVEICAIGETLIDSESANPFPRCAQTK